MAGDGNGGSLRLIAWLLGVYGTATVAAGGGVAALLFSQGRELAGLAVTVEAIKSDSMMSRANSQTAIRVVAQHGDELNGLRRQVELLDDSLTTTIETRFSAVMTALYERTDDRFRRSEFERERDQLESRIENHQHRE